MTIPVWFQDWYNNGSGGIAAAAQTYIDRVEADGGTVESIGCVPSAVWNWAAPLLLLDLYPNAAAAYSLRKLRTAYSGNAIRVRKEVSAVSSETDIGFLGDGSLDTVSLLAFASDADNGDVFVVTWYDQSLSNDATQGAGANQPKIVSSGAVITEGTSAKPAIDFDGVDDYFTLGGANDAGMLGDISVFSVNKNSISGNSVVVSTGLMVSSFAPSIQWGINGGVGQYTGTTSDGTTRINESILTSDYGSQVLVSMINDEDGNLQMFVDGVGSTGQTAVAPMNDSIFALDVGRDSGGSRYYFDGTQQELILFASDQSSNRTGIETNINTFYSIYS